MTARWDVDLETERVHFDGAWMGREDISARIQQMLASGDFKISRLSEALEHLAQAAANARTLTVKLTAEQYARIEGAGQKLGKPAGVFARDLLMQVLGSAPPAPAPHLPPPPVATANGLAAGTPDDQPMIVQPKRKESTTAPSLTPVSVAVAGQGETLTDASPVKGGGPGDGRRWFNRS